MSRTSEIRIQVRLDEANVPDQIQWSATESESPKFESAKGILISIFEENSKDTLKLDLWTKGMQVEEMDRFMYQTIRALCDTYSKATNNQSLANDMMNFAQYFGEKVEIIPPSTNT
ncbi:MAG: gliding motility protein GldC [Saprospiraceae bacterium]